MNKKNILIIIIIAVIGIACFFFADLNQTTKNLSLKNQKEILALGYEIKPGGVYYRGDLIDADPKTFEVVGSCYVKDSKRVYDACQGSMAVTGADPKTFIALSTGYGKDVKNVYWDSFVFEGADPKTFEVIGGNYAKDVKNVYGLNGIVAGADPKTAFFYKSVNDSRGSEYLKDATSVYFNETKIPNADPITFEYVGNGYSKDKNSVYYDGGDGKWPNPFSAIQGADPKTFEVVGTQYAKDKDHVYSYGKTTGAKPENCTTTNVSGCTK